MAKIGLNNFRYGLLTENPDGTASIVLVNGVKNIAYTGWHDATVEEWDGSQWNE